MDTLTVFILFFISLLFCIYNNIAILYPLFLGLVLFVLLSLRRGHTFRDTLGMIFSGSQKSDVVIKIFILIGALTAVWRACGTIPFIVYYGMAFMSAKYFILSAFLLSCLVSFLIGTALGTAGTIGVILMTMAKGGNVDVDMAAGAIIAGIYFGDRCSPMSSSAHLIASLTNTNLYINVKNMLKTSVIPFVLSIIGYIYISYENPLTFYDNQIGNEILNSFDMNIIVLLPAAIIPFLVIFRIDVKLSMTISILAGILIGIFLQHVPVLQMLNFIVTGFSMDKSGLFADIIQGGGLYSMLNASLIVIISSTYAGIFEGVGVLKEVERFFDKLSEKINVYPTTLLSSIVTASFGCNQTLAVILTQQIACKTYQKKRLSNYRLALDIENTAILISALIPWNIAGAAPAAMLSVDAGFIMYAFYIFLVPLTNLFTQNMTIKTNHSVKIIPDKNN